MKPDRISGNKTRHITDDTDVKLRQLIDESLPQAPADQWFTRKVMNRLPDKPERTAKSLPEIICYAIGIFMLVAGWGCALGYTWLNGLTMSTLMLAAVIPVVALVCLCVFAIPAIRRVL